MQPLAQALKTGFAQQVPQASGLATGWGAHWRRPVAIILLAVAAAGADVRQVMVDGRVVFSGDHGAVGRDLSEAIGRIWT